MATRQLLEAARAARERLSDASETEVELTFADGRKGSTTLTRYLSVSSSPVRLLAGLGGCGESVAQRGIHAFCSSDETRKIHGGYDSVIILHIVSCVPDARYFYGWF